MKKIALFFIALTQIGCSLNQNSSSGGTGSAIKPLIVLNNKDDGWGADIRLSITNISENDSSKIYKAVSSDNKDNLGLLIFVTKKKTNGQGFGNAITFKSLGKESDNLLHKLSTLYKKKIAADSKFADTVSASFVDLKEFAKSVAGNSGDSDSAIDEYKLFFETKNDEGELFLNINATDKWVELKEKDEDYRLVVLEALTGSRH
jgi:hypothetical protein